MIRRAQRADADALRSLWSELLAAHAAQDAAFALRSDPGAELAALVARGLADPDASVWICDGEGGPVGFCAARIEVAPPGLGEACRAEITELAVARAARRRGAGRALAEAALAWAAARGARRVEVRVAARNPEGQAFWRALGFGDFVDVLDRRL